MNVLFRYLRMTSVLLVLAFVFSACSKDKVSELTKTYDSENYEKALVMATELCKKSDPEAFLYLGMMNYYGEGIPENKELGLKYVSRAAELGDSSAMRSLGAIYYQKEQYAEAAVWFKKAADKKDTKAYVRLAGIYRNGQGVEKNDQTSSLWLNKAIAAYKKDADKGDPDAALALSKIYKDGELAPQEKNDQTSSSWLDIAIAGYKKKVDKGDFNGALSLAGIYEDEKLAHQDLKEALKWTLEAAELGSGSAQLSVAMEYYNGVKRPKDLDAAIKWFTKAAEKNHISAQEMLASIYFDNRNGVMDSNKAFEWSSKAAANGGVNALIILADCYLNGKGVSRNLELGVEWYKKAAAQGDPQAQAQLESIEKQVEQINITKEKRRREAERLSGSPIDYITLYAKANGGGLPIGKRFRFSACLIQGGIICIAADRSKNKITCATEKNFDNPQTLESFYSRSEEVECGDITASMQDNGRIGIHRFND